MLACTIMVTKVALTKTDLKISPRATRRHANQPYLHAAGDRHAPAEIYPGIPPHMGWLPVLRVLAPLLPTHPDPLVWMGEPPGAYKLACPVHLVLRDVLVPLVREESVGASFFHTFAKKKRATRQQVPKICSSGPMIHEFVFLIYCFQLCCIEYARQHTACQGCSRTRTPPGAACHWRRAWPYLRTSRAL